MTTTTRQKKKIEEEIQEIEDFSKIEEIDFEKSIPEKISSKADLMRQGFDDERNYWYERIETYSPYFKDIRKIIDLQTIIYTDRQRVSEQKSKLYAAKIKFDKNIREKRRKAFYKVKTESDFILKIKDEVNLFIDDEIKNELEKIELLHMHIEFLDSTLKTIDNIIYGIKNRIDIEQLLTR